VRGVGQLESRGKKGDGGEGKGSLRSKGGMGEQASVRGAKKGSIQPSAHNELRINPIENPKLDTNREVNPSKKGRISDGQASERRAAA
jgi:hypothetical protein